MADESPRPRFEPNPEYGRGSFWRRIKLVNRAGLIEAALEDNSHAMRCRLMEAQGIIVGLEAEMIRVPMNICPSAAAKVNELIGQPIHISYRSFYSDGKAAANCSHLFDLLWLAISHSVRSASERLYDVTIPDPVDGRATIRVDRDGALVHEWRVEDGHVTDCGPLQGQNLTRHFIRHALETFSGDELEAALVLHKGYIVARGRRYRIDDSSPLPESDARRRNACYAFQDDRVGQARRLGSRRSVNGPDDFAIFLTPWPPPRAPHL